MSDGAGGRATGTELGVTVQWCPECGTERTIELVKLTSDPEPVAVCTECGAGVDRWLSPDLPELVTPRTATDWLGAEHGKGVA